MDFNADHFTLFGLPRSYRLDPLALDKRYREIQSEVHPDRFAQAGDSERRLSLQWATRVNEAYQTLRKPLPRAQYLLSLSGHEVDSHSNTAMPPEFLMEQMEWREALGEAREAADEDVLDELARRIRQNTRALVEELGRQLDDTVDLEAAADTIRRMKFLEKLQHEINDALTALES